VAWDATSLKDLMSCAELYNLKHNQGWHARGASVHLQFGHAAGAALERFHRGIIEQGEDHDTALRGAIRTALEETWVDGKPTLGSYEHVWRCLGTTKFKNPKGNAAKCPWSHKGKFFPAPGPGVCGSCGSETAESYKWFPTLAGKDRLALVRLLVWYGEEIKNGALKPMSMEVNGKHHAMVEVYFTEPFMVINGVQISLCGWFDSIKALGEEVLVTDYKTTKNDLGTRYFSQYSPNIQVDLYDLIAAATVKGMKYSGVVIEAVQTLASGVRFGWRIFQGSDDRRRELLKELQFWITSAYNYAVSGFYPRNRSHCAMCEFKKVCAAEPQSRPHILAEQFDRYRWNPQTRKQEPWSASPSTKSLPPSAPAVLSLPASSSS
jgi:hypothetical protein